MDKKESLDALVNDYKLDVKEMEEMTKSEMEDLLDELYSHTVEEE